MLIKISLFLAAGPKEMMFLKLLFFVIWQLKNLELAVNLAKRGNLPGADELVSLH